MSRTIPSGAYPSVPEDAAAVTAGTVLPVRVRKVFATGTTASNLVRVF